jgi:hypothetical protein
MNKIQMPTPEEKRRSIDFIVSQSPEKSKLFFHEISNLLRSIGVRGLFFGVGDAAFLAITAALIIGAFFIVGIEKAMYSVIFFTSPLTYILLYSLTMWKENLTGTLELHKTLRISTRHITAVRMLFFGGGSVAVNGVISLFAYSHANRHEITVSFFRLLEISFCSLFIFAAILLFVMLKTHTNKGQIVFLVAWCVIGAVGLIQAIPAFNDFLQAVPAFTMTGIAVIFAVLFIIQSKLYFRRTNYAYS